jgi:hypothetical protein
MKMSFVLMVCTASLLGIPIIATAKNYPLRVISEPSGALVSVRSTMDAVSAESIRTVAGETPMEKDFDFPKGNTLRLEIEKRGYLPGIVDVTPETGTVTIKLEKAKDKTGEEIEAYAIPSINRLLVVTPEFDVIKRGFAGEEVALEESVAAQNSLIKGIQSYFAGRYEVVPVQTSGTDTHPVKSLWRDARTAMELTDPIRLKYLQYPPCLETKSGRKAARSLGANHKGEALLLLSGKMNRETAGMVLGKLGLFAAGTASSYCSGYANAAARGDSFFVYTVYIPHFEQGTLLKAMLVDCSSGEIVWINKGVWGVMDFGNAGDVTRLTEDLFSGLKQKQKEESR